MLTGNKKEEMTIFNELKFRELLLYVASRCEGDANFGAIKLNKMLFLADFTAYAYLGESISGAEYEALELGPAPRLLKPIRDDMVKNNDIVVREQTRFGYAQHRVIPLRDPDLTLFSGAEIALVDHIIEVFREDTGKDLSELTHGMYGWQIAQYKEVIPYSSVFLSNEPVTKADQERARELIAQHGW